MLIYISGMQQTSDKPLKYDSYHDPVRAISAGCLEGAVLDCKSFGEKRYHQRYRTGRDWKRDHGRRPNYVPQIYLELRKLLEFLYSFRFGCMCEILGFDVEQVRERLLEMMAGEPVPNEPVSGG